MTTTPNDDELRAENARLRNELNALDKALRCEGWPLDARLVRAKELAMLGESRADLRVAGKMIVGDVDAVCLSMRAEVLRLRAALEAQWLIAHDEHCTNMRDCASFGGLKPCHHLRP